MRNKILKINITLNLEIKLKWIKPSRTSDSLFLTEGLVQHYIVYLSDYPINKMYLWVILALLRKWKIIISIASEKSHQKFWLIWSLFSKYDHKNHNDQILNRSMTWTVSSSRSSLLIFLVFLTYVIWRS